MKHLAALFLLTAACGPSTLTIQAKYPTEPKVLEPDNGIKVRIGEITDARTLASEAEKISIPAYWGEEETRKDASHTIGAKTDKGTLANIHLADSQSIESILADLLSVAFRQAGYRVVDDDEADLTIDATIDQFWTWMTPGGMTIRIESSVQATLAISGAAGSAEIEAAGFHDYRDASTSPDSYAFALNEALFDFYTNLATSCLEFELEQPEE
jgi:hypothetical protein